MATAPDIEAVDEIKDDEVFDVGDYGDEVDEGEEIAEDTGDTGDAGDSGSVIHKPELPPREIAVNVPIVEKSAVIGNWFPAEEGKIDFGVVAERIGGEPNLNMAERRFADNERAIQMNVDETEVSESRKGVRKTFEDVKAAVGQDDVLVNSIDWEFWSDVSNRYDFVLRERYDELQRKVSIGIPAEIRGMVWQIVSESNSNKLKEFFIHTREHKSNFAKLIRRDLMRTKFVNNDEVIYKAEDLFNVIKTYSLYDTEVGYTQGMAFVCVPLLINMGADEAFCALVRLMFTYGFRDFFLPEMPGLKLRMYQFDRILEETVPDLYTHLRDQQIMSSMYATQWFLTVFAYKLPLATILRIYDVVIAEGLESLLKFAVNLMIKNKKALLELEFESLLEFLSQKIFYCYMNEEEILTDEFIIDSMAVEILPLTLDKYRYEFDQITAIEMNNLNKVKELESNNGLIMREIRQVESNYAILNKQHLEIANEMVEGKISVGSLEMENEELSESIKLMIERLNNLRAGRVGVDFSSESATTSLGEGLDAEIKRTMEENLAVMDENMALEEKLAEVTEENERLKAESSNSGLGMFKLKKGKFW